MSGSSRTFVAAASATSFWFCSSISLCSVDKIDFFFAVVITLPRVDPRGLLVGALDEGGAAALAFFAAARVAAN